MILIISQSQSLRLIAICLDSDWLQETMLHYCFKSFVKIIAGKQNDSKLHFYACSMTACSCFYRLCIKLYQRFGAFMKIKSSFEKIRFEGVDYLLATVFNLQSVNNLLKIYTPCFPWQKGAKGKVLKPSI